MCAVLDASIAGELFTNDRSPIADLFFRWMQRGGRIVVGGKQFKELLRNQEATLWLAQARLAGRLTEQPAAAVVAKTAELDVRNDVRSDDAHVLAVALVSGARLLYSNDRELQADFKDREIVNPPGSIYTSLPVPLGRGKRAAETPRRVTSAHRGVLANPDLCPDCDA